MRIKTEPEFLSGPKIILIDKIIYTNANVKFFYFLNGLPINVGRIFVIN